MRQNNQRLTQIFIDTGPGNIHLCLDLASAKSARSGRVWDIKRCSDLSSATTSLIEPPSHAGRLSHIRHAEPQPFGSVGRARNERQPLTNFSDFGLNKNLLQALAGKGYTQPTPIQEQAIPAVLTGGDVLGIAQTGTGKTAAFALPILQRLNTSAARRPKTCKVLVLAPTRELASQICESFKTYGRHMGVSAAVVYGGVKYGAQTKALARGIDVLVATPGRLLDHLGQRTIDLSATEVLVLDEVDQMLDLGFIAPIRKIVSHLPKTRQNLFFSATMPSEIEKLAGELLHNPSRVAVTPVASTVELVEQRVLFVDSQRKRDALVDLMAEPDMKRVIVFTRTKRGADRLAEHLDRAGIDAAAIHGDKSQGQRERALAGFKSGQSRALIATDIAARGIDVDNISHVVNFELPHVPEAYVHRIGRTARAGKGGIAVTLCAPEERGLLRDIQRLTGIDLGAGDGPRGAQPPRGRNGQQPRKPQQPHQGRPHGSHAPQAANGPRGPGSGPRHKRRPGKGGSEFGRLAARLGASTEGHRSRPN